MVLRDPDGYFIKFSTCNDLEKTLDQDEATLASNLASDTKVTDDEEQRGIGRFWKKVMKEFIWKWYCHKEFIPFCSRWIVYAS